MARIQLGEVDRLDVFLREMHDGARADDWSTQHCARAFHAHPRLLEDYLSFYYPWHSERGVLSARLKELVRLHIATLNGCKTCAAARLDRNDISEAEALAVLGVDWSTLDSLDERENAALEFADQMALNHHAVTNEDVTRWRRLFGDDGFLELAVMTTPCVGFGRVLAVLQLETVACPI